MTQATQQIAEGHFDVRVDGHRGDELGTLSQAINSMAQRLDGFVTGQKRFLGDIAHELCSPLARLRVALGILEERVSGSQQPDVSRAAEQADEIAALVNELLSFSKASLGATHAKLQQVPLRALVDLAIRREVTNGEQVETKIASDLRVEVEPELLTRALANLLRNAIRYAGKAGPITITAEPRDGQVALSVSDCGPGIPEAELQRIFDPFYRLDASRDRETGGVRLPRNSRRGQSSSNRAASHHHASRRVDGTPIKGATTERHRVSESVRFAGRSARLYGRLPRRC
jgi:two-component system sensor histidine kinase CpxA